MPDPTELFGGMFGSENVDPNVARGYINQHRGAMAGRDAEINDVKSKQQANIDQMSKLLDETVASLRASREGRSNLPLLALGAGMLSAPGNFGQQVGAGLKMMVPTIAAQREEEDQFQNNLSNIGLKRAAITNAPLDEQLRYLKALQVGDINAIRSIESSIIKASGKNADGVDPALVKEYKFWEQAPENKGKPFHAYMEWKSRLGSDRNTPSLLRELDEVNRALEAEGKPRIGVTEYLRQKSGAQASGKAEGTAAAEAFESLPGLVNNAEVMAGSIDQILNHPGLPKAVGLSSVLPSIPGGQAADFEAQLDKLKGQAFLQMFNQLRGGGAITEMEGKKATDALAALSTKQSEKQFRANLKEVNDILAKGIAVARQKARLDPMKTGEPAPKTGTLSLSNPPRTATNPVTGERMIERNGKWEKME